MDGSHPSTYRSENGLWIGTRATKISLLAGWAFDQPTSDDFCQCKCCDQRQGSKVECCRIEHSWYPTGDARGKDVMKVLGFGNYESSFFFLASLFSYLLNWKLSLYSHLAFLSDSAAISLNSNLIFFNPPSCLFIVLD